MTKNIVAIFVLAIATEQVAPRTLEHVEGEIVTCRAPDEPHARLEQVTVQGLNEKGRSVRLKVEGYLARVFQHEIDHLDGILYTDKLTDPDTFQPVETGQEETAELEAAMS